MATLGVARCAGRHPGAPWCADLGGELPGISQPLRESRLAPGMAHVRQMCTRAGSVHIAGCLFGALAL
eukprot:7581228-Alexandrium_andersonii.AAC.1